jgi:hypothetical protein
MPNPNHKNFSWLSLLMAISLIIFITNAKAQPYSLPAGNFTNTCQQCTFGEDHILTCECDTGTSTKQHSRLLVSNTCLYIENIQGTLHCTHTKDDIESFDLHTVVPSQFDQLVGELYSSRDAENKCPSVCDHVDAVWTGQWKKAGLGVNSTCQCYSQY